MTPKSDAKIKEKLICDFKYDMRNLMNSNPPNHSKVQKFHFDGVFLSKVYEVWTKKPQESSFITLNSNSEFE